LKTPRSIVGGIQLSKACGGVPIISWPFFAVQHINCWYSCSEWGIGMEIDNDVKKDDAEKLVRELMEGDKGEEIKRKVMEWKMKAEEKRRSCEAWWFLLPELGQVDCRCSPGWKCLNQLEEANLSFN
jgi:hypothetical protein